jgi:ribose transport system ATP-binding protein
MTILKKISIASVVNKKEEKRIAKKYSEELNIKTPNLEQQVKNLSGGNQQKVILAKWLASGPELIILDEPTRGIDVGAKYEIYKLVNTLIESGKTILMISSEMGELMGMSDRIVVLSEGRITGVVNKSDFNQERIMSYASKAKGMVPMHEDR